MITATSPTITRLGAFIDATVPAMAAAANQLKGSPDAEVLSEVVAKAGNLRRELLGFHDPLLAPGTTAGDHVMAGYHNLEVSAYLVRPEQLTALGTGTVQDMVRHQLLSVVANLDAVRAALGITTA